MTFDMKKYELSGNLKTLYRCTKKEPFFVDVPTMNYLTFDGSGHPAQEDFQISCEALFNLSYIIKFEIARKELQLDYKVNPMEVTWYLDKSTEQISFTWTMMIMQPDFVTESMVEKAIRIAREKGKQLAYDRVHFQTVEFVRCVQCFHPGDYRMMNDTLAKMIAFAQKNGLSHDLYTHDIYLNDMRKTKVENYKTIMRIRTRPT